MWLQVLLVLQVKGFQGLKLTCGIKARLWHQGDAFVAEGSTQLLDLGFVINLGSVGAMQC